MEKLKFAHRGLHSKKNGIPENSMAAFERAVHRGYGIELDVRLSADGVPVVFHDRTLNRMTGADGEIESMRLNELKRLTLDGGKCRIPTLCEVLRLVNGRVPLLIEIKSGLLPFTLMRRVMRCLRGYRGRIMIQSFNPLVLLWLRVNAAHITRGQLAHKKRWYDIARFFAKPHFVAYDINEINPRLSKALKKKKIPLLCWNIDIENEKDRKKSYRLCDGMIFE